MIKKNDGEFIWSEAYRPRRIADCILPDALKKDLQAIVDSGNLANYILEGTSGLGKTTVARALCDELDLEHIVINASNERNIEVVRTKMQSFASTMSIFGADSDKPKVIILDEADYLNAESTQPALRAFIEEFSSNCRFILTCNFKNKLIQPLHSRCTPISFNTSKQEMAKLAAQFMGRMKEIMVAEGVKYEPKILADVIMRYAPDWRRVLQEAQRYSVGGTLNPLAAVDSMSDQGIAEVVGYLRTKDFKAMRAWVANNAGLDGTVTFRRIYDSLNNTAKPESIPQAVLILADYSYKSAFMADKELNLVACFTELMANVEWKKP